MKSIYLTCLLMWTASLSAAVPEFIVTAPNPSRLDKVAEEELQFFYSKIYGRKLQKINEAQAKGKSAIYLGRTALSVKTVDVSKANHEEWVLQTAGNNLIITGGIPAGTLYGVYALLEKLGVAFVAPTETVIPKHKPDFPKLRERKKPAFAGRLIYDGIGNQLVRTRAPKESVDLYVKWLLRNRINGQTKSDIKPVYVGGIYNIPHYPYHNLCDYVPRSLYKTHPEYFQMDELGRRVMPKEEHREGSLCMSNPEVRKITLDSLRRKIIADRKKFPKDEWPYVYDISTLDNTGYICRCPKCKAIADSDGSETGLLLDYLNYVAREIRKEYPEIIIRTFGQTPPKKIMPEKNLLIWLDDHFSRRSPFMPTESTMTAADKKMYAGWRAANATLMMWDYWNLGGETYYNPPRVETVFDTIQPDLKFFLKNKVGAMFIEASMDNCSPQNFMLLNFYTAAHLMVDPDADVEKLADEFIRGYYGPYAAMAKRYFNAIRAGIRNHKQPDATSCGAGHWNYLTPDFMLGFYRDIHSITDKAAANDRFAERMSYESITPIWYTLANWPSYERKFTTAGITREKLIKECQQLVHKFIRRQKGTRPQRSDNDFAAEFSRVLQTAKRPEKFKNVPNRNFRMITHYNFKPVAMFDAKIVDDPESIQGKALRSADCRPERHGVDVLIDKKYNFRSTQFVLGNFRAPGRVALLLKSVPQDEKYHWFRIPGSLELRPVSDFWGHGWAIQAPTNHWFMLTNGDPMDNMWDQVWFSAKFTGPAYVKGSKKENAIYVDMAVITRGEKETQFQPVANYDLTGLDKTGKLPENWHIVNYYKPTGTTEVFEKEGKKAIRMNACPKNLTVIEGPIFTCNPDDVVSVRFRAKGKDVKCQVGLYYYKKAGFICGKFVNVPDNGRRNEFIFPASDLNRKDVARCALAFLLPKGSGTCEFDQIEVRVAKDLNKYLEVP